MSTNISRYPSNFKDLGSKGKLLTWSFGIFFQGFGEINALFSEVDGAQTPPPPPGGLTIKGNPKFK